MSELSCSDFALPVLLPFIKVSMYIDSVRGSPNGTIGSQFQFYHWRANVTIGITIGTNGITNGTIGKKKH